ncbi:MAG: Holliday junction resolvase RuvX [Alphaproteobacteria bacterium]|nr:Holliday junction resolvase RuvX [Rhodobiaceae bacterium]PDH51465.1 MAG: Holliday junction resolvase RuvX [alpha proteobacterium MED-G09]|tara:strand:+ start:7874 stop:8338 length:465 start_codon:yes stop_codon:yes gene_type:complete
MINDSNNFREIIPNNKTILCLDLGKKRIGLAISDINQKIASPYDVIKEKKFSEILIILKNLIKKFDIGSIIIGDPINMDGSLGPKSQSSRSFISNISKDIDIPILLWDERLSTIAAEKSLIEADISRKKRGEVIDKIAANIILQSFLDFLNSNP